MNTVGKQYGFRVNAARCTGCKTCEMACRDAYQLGETPSFRRVCEASGGTWMQEGAAWRHQVFTYYLSIACNHCDDPVCQQVCPSGAMRKQDDGFVVLDSNQCIGCGSCAFACPYKAPSYSRVLRVMRKCDGCRARVEEGRVPLCVEACPMRALEFGEIDEIRGRHGSQCDVAPLPPGSYTRPNIVITSHRHGCPSDTAQCVLANGKEI